MNVNSTGIIIILDIVVNTLHFIFYAIVCNLINHYYYYYDDDDDDDGLKSKYSKGISSTCKTNFR